MSELYGSPIMYLCDPEKNKDCKKTMCQKECFHCHKKAFSKDGKPLRFNLNTWEWDEVEESESKKILVLKAKRNLTFQHQDIIMRKLREDINHGICIIPNDFDYEWIDEDDLKKIENAMFSFLPMKTKPSLWERIKRRFKK